MRKRSSMGIKIFGLLLVILGAWNILMVSDANYSKAVSFEQLRINTIAGIIGVSCGIGIILLNRIFRNITILFSLWAFYWHVNDIFNFPSREEIANFIVALGYNLANLESNIDMLSKILRFALMLPAIFYLFLILFLIHPKVKEQFR